MNPLMAARLTEVAMEGQDAARLVRLRDQLIAVGVVANLRDNNSALMIPREDSTPLWVVMSYGGAFYSWQSGKVRHPADDPVGAAAALAEFLGRS
ncbi:hypothetical protein HNP84_000265 [Thermocatellispora tengchongensis]|uniref:Uncharacterized protein n=1 Tax=Thermocatellispora tengchongensis TaxID=1073253 RepID=A0A840NZZ2_9ACTN|nr:hypothetical protein [Thermocatellispora tengchongensis]MBB5130577.1 hypothetical protein [Thermocatellispora tengchongensis]